MDESQQLPNTSGASAPFWSPDSRSVGFFADGQLKRIELDGGAVQTLARAVSGSGGTWSDGGRILFSPSRLSPISSIAATGGAVTTVTEVDLMREITHLSPSFLPDGDRFLYYVQSGADARGVYLGGPEGLEPRRLLDADAPAVYASGHLLYVRQAALLAQPFDVATLELVGDPFTVAEGVLADPGRSLTALSAAAAGPIAYRRAADTDRSALTWFDRAVFAGREMGCLPIQRIRPLRDLFAVVSGSERQDADLGRRRRAGALGRRRT